ncbi:MAG TPA: AmmeMemoRadiSam system protein A [Candidatus Bipolaricaulota bacterium]|nr:AmmeMemoRadiSam system protein A [Candidatus Bipolaricaulota bacterium]
MFSLSDFEKKELLKLAKAAIEAQLEGADFNPETQNPVLLENHGVFVTLYKNGELRGCIGYIEPVSTIWQAVINNAVSAAFEDPRFMPLQKQELTDIKLEISVLSVPQKTNINHVKQGINGVVIRRGGRKATYLPDVWKHFKNKEDFYASLCVKAGLEEGAWKKNDVDIYVYETETFGHGSCNT